MRYALAVALLLPSVALAGNYAECILEAVPGIRHQQVLRSAVRACQDKHPEGFEGVRWGDGRGLFGKYKSTDECFAAEGRETSMNAAASLVFRACDRLYGEAPKPNFFDQFDPPSQPAR